MTHGGHNSGLKNQFHRYLLQTAIAVSELNELNGLLENVYAKTKDVGTLITLTVVITSRTYEAQVSVTKHPDMFW